MIQNDLQGETMSAGVYVIVNTCNGKVYVGSSKDVLPRWLYHRRDMRANRHHSRHLQRAWNKYGESAFAYAIAEIASESDLIQVEQRWIDATKATDKRYGYNICPQADRTKHSDDTRRLLSEAAKVRLAVPQNNPMYGKEHSDESKARIAAKKRGRKLSVSHCRNIGLANLGSKSPRAKAVDQFDLNGNRMARWGSINEAARAIGRNHSCIVACCTGNQRTAYGFVWKYQGD